MSTDYGVIGLGIIGYGIASNFRKQVPANTTVYLYDINHQTVQRLRHEFGSGGKIEVAATPKDIANKDGTVLSGLPADILVKKVYRDEKEGMIAAKENPNRLITDRSTIQIEFTQEVCKKNKDAGQGSFTDATVSGGMWGANARTLSFMFGHAEPTETDTVGSASTRRCRWSGFRTPSPSVTGWGWASRDRGDGDRLEICHYKNALSKCVREGTANSWVVGLEQPVPALMPDALSSNKYKKAFGPELSVKDLTLCIKATRNVEINPSAGEVALRAFEAVKVDPQTKDLDHTSLWLHVYGNLDEWARDNLPSEGRGELRIIEAVYEGNIY